MSCMTLVQRLGGSSALLVSGIVVIRVLPAAVLFPFAGVVADRSTFRPLTSCHHAASLTVGHRTGRP